MGHWEGARIIAHLVTSNGCCPRSRRRFRALRLERSERALPFFNDSGINVLWRRVAEHTRNRFTQKQTRLYMNTRTVQVYDVAHTRRYNNQRFHAAINGDMSSTRAPFSQHKDSITDAAV